MEICNSCDIVYEGRYCPLCKANDEIGDLNNQITDLTEDISNLKSENNDLRNELARSRIQKDLV